MYYSSYTNYTIRKRGIRATPPLLPTSVVDPHTSRSPHERRRCSKDMALRRWRTSVLNTQGHNIVDTSLCNKKIKKDPMDNTFLLISWSYSEDWVVYYIKCERKETHSALNWVLRAKQIIFSRFFGGPRNNVILLPNVCGVSPTLVVWDYNLSRSTSGVGNSCPREPDWRHTFSLAPVNTPD